MNNDVLYQIGLTLIPKIGNILAKSLISYTGSAEEVFRAPKKELLKVPGIGRAMANNIIHQKVLNLAEREIKFLEKYDIQPLCYLDKDYPQRLKHYEESPVMLYYKGTASLNQSRHVSIVGTRTPTPIGIANCEQLIHDLTPYQPLVISGLAFGIDITAHRKCLAGNLQTVGVMGHGMHRIYPAQHRLTAMKMLEQGGILTEFTYTTEPNREHFPMRNRIIAGMCDALVVVETMKKGGSIISAKFGNSYNKDVFAFPGRIIDSHSKGCNHLIKTHQAALIESAADIVYLQNWDLSKEKKAGFQKQLFVELTENEKLIVNALKLEDQRSIDVLGFETKLAPGLLSSVLLSLEFKGVVKSLPGKQFMMI